MNSNYQLSELQQRLLIAGSPGEAGFATVNDRQVDYAVVCRLTRDDIPELLELLECASPVPSDSGF